MKKIVLTIIFVSSFISCTTNNEPVDPKLFPKDKTAQTVKVIENQTVTNNDSRVK